MTDERFSFPTDLTKPEAALVEILFNFTLLTEYQLLDLQGAVREFVARMSEAVLKIDAIASDKSLSKADVEEKLRPHIYTLVECLNFEDIQSQRLEHLTRSTRLHSEGIMTKLKSEMKDEDAESVRLFGLKLAKLTRAMYTMPEERQIFDQVFHDSLKKMAQL